MNDSQTFRPQAYTRFEYVQIGINGADVDFHYRLVGPTDVDFVENWTFPNPISDSARPLVRLLFLAAGMSYYKAAAPDRIRLVGAWDKEESAFAHRLVRHGLGEFAFRNNLPSLLDPTIDPDFEADVPAPVAYDGDPDHALVPVGGGKDSCVTIEALRDHVGTETLFSVNSYPSINAVARAAELPIINAKKTLSPQIFTVNDQGALNGHVPVTAINSLAALITAVGIGAGAVYMSNERSASAGNVKWDEDWVNHQWSKSLEFESDLQSLVRRRVEGLTYASLLRPYSEFRIAEAFARMTEYHQVFNSCGRAFRARPGAERSPWCGECSKCQFVAVILAPFLDRDDVANIFGRQMLVDSEAEYLELAGIGAHKPWDCVGEVLETRYAIDRAVNSSWRDDTFMLGLRQQIPADQMPSQDQISELLAASSEHCLPSALATVLD